MKKDNTLEKERAKCEDIIFDCLDTIIEVSGNSTENLSHAKRLVATHLAYEIFNWGYITGCEVGKFNTLDECGCLHCHRNETKGNDKKA